MDRSPELRDLLLGFYEALSKGDASFIDRHFSVAEHARGIGTDPGEWWQGPRVAAAWNTSLARGAPRERPAAALGGERACLATSQGHECPLLSRYGLLWVAKRQ